MAVRQSVTGLGGRAGERVEDYMAVEMMHVYKQLESIFNPLSYTNQRHCFQ